MVNIFDCGRQNEGLIKVAELSIALAETPNDERVESLAETLHEAVMMNASELSAVDAEVFAFNTWNRLLLAVNDDPTDDKLAALTKAVGIVLDGICSLPCEKLIDAYRILGDLGNSQADEAVALIDAPEFSDKPVVRYAINRGVLNYLMGLDNFTAHMEHVKTAIAALGTADAEVVTAMEPVGLYIIPLGVKE